MLARRLSRRGVPLSVGSLAVLLAQESASASMPTRLIGSTAQAASLIAAGRAVTAGVVSAEVVTLTEGVLKTMLLSKIKFVTVALMLVAVVGGVGGMFRARLNTAMADQPNATRGRSTDQGHEGSGGLGHGAVAESGVNVLPRARTCPNPRVRFPSRATD